METSPSQWQKELQDIVTFRGEKLMKLLKAMREL